MWVLKEVRNRIIRNILVVAIVLCNLALCRSAFSTVSFRKLVCLENSLKTVLSLNQDIQIYVIMLCNFDM